MVTKNKKPLTSSRDFLVCTNPQATRRYDIEERIEAGMVLMGSEVKSLRARRADLEPAYASLLNGELMVHHMHIAPYLQAGVFGHEATRSRKLLIHKRQLEKLQGRLTLRGYTLVPTKVYFKNGFAKIELGLGKGREKHDKRELIKRDIDRKEARQAVQRCGK